MKTRKELKQWNLYGSLRPLKALIMYAYVYIKVIRFIVYEDQKEKKTKL